MLTRCSSQTMTWKWSNPLTGYSPLWSNYHEHNFTFLVLFHAVNKYFDIVIQPLAFRLNEFVVTVIRSGQHHQPPPKITTLVPYEAECDDTQANDTGSDLFTMSAMITAAVDDGFLGCDDYNLTNFSLSQTIRAVSFWSRCHHTQVTFEPPRYCCCRLKFG